MTEACYALTIFRSELTPRTLALFAGLLMAKYMHSLVNGRMNSFESYAQRQALEMEANGGAPPAEEDSRHSRLGRIRFLLLASSLLALDVVLCFSFMADLLQDGVSVLMLFAFEASLMGFSALHTLSRYMVHRTALRIERATGTQWRNKSWVLMHLRLGVGTAKLVLLLVYFTLVLTYYGIPLIMVRDLFMAFRVVHQEMSNVIAARRLARDLQARFFRPTPAECEEAGGVDAITHADLTPDDAILLPCRHIFQEDALMSWFERQRVCPVCRYDITQPDPAWYSRERTARAAGRPSPLRRGQAGPEPAAADVAEAQPAPDVPAPAVEAAEQAGGGAAAPAPAPAPTAATAAPAPAPMPAAVPAPAPMAWQPPAPTNTSASAASAAPAPAPTPAAAGPAAASIPGFAQHQFTAGQPAGMFVPIAVPVPVPVPVPTDAQGQPQTAGYDFAAIQAQIMAQWAAMAAAAAQVQGPAVAAMQPGVFGAAPVPAPASATAAASGRHDAAASALEAEIMALEAQLAAMESDEAQSPGQVAQPEEEHRSTPTPPARLQTVSARQAMPVMSTPGTRSEWTAGSGSSALVSNVSDVPSSGSHHEEGEAAGGDSAGAAAAAGAAVVESDNSAASDSGRDGDAEEHNEAARSPVHLHTLTEDAVQSIIWAASSPEADAAADSASPLTQSRSAALTSGTSRGSELGADLGGDDEADGDDDAGSSIVEEWEEAPAVDATPVTPSSLPQDYLGLARARYLQARASAAQLAEHSDSE